jgi:hypothetical protein
MKAKKWSVLGLFITLVIFASTLASTENYAFIDFAKEIFDNTTSATAYQYNATDNQGCRSDTLKIMEK